ncbi:MAG: type I methionyl aminopeptidase [Myxococcus sp.]|nr:type I methionyl aminopeptidase [Myxococcus sp.]
MPASTHGAARRPPNKLPRPNDPCWCGTSEKYKKCHKEADQVFLKEERKRLEANKVVPGEVTPKREVPIMIRRPDYAETGVPSRGSGRNVRTPEELVRMRRACRAAAEVLRKSGEQVKPGVTTDSIDAYSHDLIVSLGGYPSPLNYRGFPKSICSSVNEVICHGIPDGRVLLDGDIVNLDITVFLDGMHGDCNATFLVGDSVDDESRALVRVTHECLMKGIEAVRPGRPISDIGRAIELHADAHGYGVVRSYCGHGIGDVFHSNLQIPHYFDARSNTRMEPGMTFTIEPMITLGTWEESHWNDDWTVVTKDLRRTAQFEHTVLVTETGVEILTRE